MLLNREISVTIVMVVELGIWIEIIPIENIIELEGLPHKYTYAHILVYPRIPDAHTYPHTHLYIMYMFIILHKYQ